jgi:uncharacterized protein YecE (DUF72 family)
MPGRIVVGTAGWSNGEWYPPGVPPRDRLAWYARRFDGVEVDSTFYALPARRTVARWAQVTPSGFSFDVKLHRLLSRHAAPLSSLPTALRGGATLGDRGRVVLDEQLQQAMCRQTLAAIEPLREAGKLSAFLLQLTPAFRPADHQLGELEQLIEELAPVPVAIELRHRDWLRDLEQTLAWFRTTGAAFVCVDAPPVTAPHVLPPVDAVTRDDLAYLRAHGRNAEGYLRGRSAAERFDWSYSDDELREVGGRTQALAEAAARVELMFGNGRHAAEAATRMREILGQGRPDALAGAEVPRGS